MAILEVLGNLSYYLGYCVAEIGLMILRPFPSIKNKVIAFVESM